MFFHTRFDMKELSEMSIVNHVWVKLYGTKNTATSATILILLSSQELKARENSKRVSTTCFSLIIFPEMFNLDPQKHDLRFNLMTDCLGLFVCICAYLLVYMYVCVWLFICLCHALYVQFLFHYSGQHGSALSQAGVSKLKDVAWPQVVWL